MGWNRRPIDRGVSACVDAPSRSPTVKNPFRDTAGALLKAIEAQFGSLAALQETMSAQTVAVQGSGWGWLGCVDCMYGSTG